AFCRRQWALIHIEQQWNENLRTVEGNILHESAHNDDFTEKRGDVIITRGMPVFSRTLGTSGTCDVVEFHKTEEGVSIFGRDGKYLPTPIEYKRGKPKEDDIDALQLCAQAMCMEEMLICQIKEGYLYYGETRHRLKISFDKELRNKVTDMFQEMHELYTKQHTPRVKPTKACNACSLMDICMPRLYKTNTVKEYIDQCIKEEIQ
ncbi:MAG: CRISPR-associated protein Cas4, partial [Mobilitalea sp.]